jgi:hypothetical protein
MYFVGKISDKSLVETSGTYLPDDPPDAAILTNIKARLGGVDADYSVYHISNTGSDAQRVLTGDSVALTWTGDSVTGISFASEDAKKWIQSSIDKTFILADGVEEAIINITILTANKSGTDTSFNGNLDINIGTPTGGNKYRFYFYNGVASRSLKTTNAGKFTIPAGRMTDYRIDNTVTLEAIQ